MIRLVCILFAIGIPNYSFSQTEKVLTQGEQLNLRSGILIERKFIDIGKIRDLSVKVLKYRDFNSNESQSVLRFELSSKYSTDTKIASLDADEIDALEKSIRSLQLNVLPTKPDVYTEVTYNSKGDFSAGAFYNMSKGIWTSYIELERRNSFYSISIEEFQILLNLIDQAKQKM